MNKPYSIGFNGHAVICKCSSCLTSYRRWKKSLAASGKVFVRGFLRSLPKR